MTVDFFVPITHLTELTEKEVGELYFVWVCYAVHVASTDVGIASTGQVCITKFTCRSTVWVMSVLVHRSVQVWKTHEDFTITNWNLVICIPPTGDVLQPWCRWVCGSTCPHPPASVLYENRLVPPMSSHGDIVLCILLSHSAEAFCGCWPPAVTVRTATKAGKCEKCREQT